MYVNTKKGNMRGGDCPCKLLRHLKKKRCHGHVSITYKPESKIKPIVFHSRKSSSRLLMKRFVIKEKRNGVEGQKMISLVWRGFQAFPFLILCHILLHLH